jgi:uncharacterized protein with HEPN domain
VPSRNPGQRLQDIIENIEAVREIISEASRRLPDDLKSKHPGVDWQAIAAAGNVYRHEYEAVVPAVVWHTATQQLHPLEVIARKELAQIDEAN